MAAFGGRSLAFLALAPQVVNTFVTSFPVERQAELDLEDLHALHVLRPALDGATIAAAAGLLAGRALGVVGGGAVALGLGGALALRGLAQLITAQSAHPAYDGPVTRLHAADADLDPLDEVVGVVIAGEAVCYPLRLLEKPAAIADTVGGVPITTTFCPMSRAAVAFHDDWGGARLRLQAVGAPGNDLAFYADVVGGVISQLRARIMTGRNAGVPLRAFPAHRTTWAHWRALHPDTTVGVWPTGPKGAYLEWLIGAAMRSDARSPEPLYATSHRDPRLPAKAQVLGICAGGTCAAIERASLPLHGELRVTVGAEEVVVTVADDAATAVSARDGRPVELLADRVWWFAWSATHPGTAILTPHQVGVGAL